MAAGAAVAENSMVAAVAQSAATPSAARGRLRDARAAAWVVLAFM
jgi:hypothetical protein